MPDPNTVAALWDEFAAQVFRPGVPYPDIQKLEMQRAFYAGCYAMFTDLERIANSYSERRVATICAGMFNEMTGFIEQQIRQHGARRTT